MKNSIKQSTYTSYEGYIRVHLKPALGNTLLRDLTPRMLQLYYNYKIETEGLSQKTIININLFLHKALSFAVSEKYIQSNPAEALNLSRGQKPQIEILTRDEQARLMRATFQHRYGIFVRLVLFSGIRLGELLGLKWEDFDFRSGMFHIRRTLNRLRKTKQPVSPNEAHTEIVIQTPKSQNSVRSIPMMPQVAQDILQWKKLQEKEKAEAGDAYIESGMFVTNPFGGYVEPRTFKDYYNQILDIAGLQHFTFHALRHTFASRAMEQGMDPKTLSTILGHANVSFTLDTYAHVLDDHKKDGMALMEDLYDVEPIVQISSYPIVVTTLDDGSMAFSSPDFPSVSYNSFNIPEGLSYMKERLEDEVLISYTSTPTPPDQVQLRQNQFMMMVQV